MEKSCTVRMTRDRENELRKEVSIPHLDSPDQAGHYGMFIEYANGFARFVVLCWYYNFLSNLRGLSGWIPQLLNDQ